MFKLTSPCGYGIRLGYMYLYSPILLDSQEVIKIISGTTVTAFWVRCVVLTTKVVFTVLGQWTMEL